MMTGDEKLMPRLGAMKSEAAAGEGMALLVAGYACAQLLLLATLIVNHVPFALFLETMEGVVLQHAVRASALLPIYPAPTADFVPLAYNPLFYVLAAPVFWVTGPGLSVLRAVAVAGYGLALGVTYLAVAGRTGSRWWGLVAAGLLAAAYGRMDAYLDTAHSDSWLIAAALVGFLLLDRARTPLLALPGIASLCAAFWFKQHGAVFAGFGVLYVTWRFGWRASWPAWALVALLGPGLYFGLGPTLFGSHFIFLTLEVPGGWSEVTVRALARFALTMALAYPVLLVCAGVWLSDGVRGASWQKRDTLSAWDFALLAGLVSGLLATLDAGGLKNTYAPAGAMLIVAGSIAMARGNLRLAGWLGPRTSPTTLAAFAFVTLAYNPLPYVVSARAGAAYDDLVGVLRGLGGPVASPSLGQLPRDFALSPALLWVAYDDMARGPRASAKGRQLAARLQDTLVAPTGPAYILSNLPLEDGFSAAGLQDHFVRVADYGTRFAPLGGLPSAFFLRSSYPRYLFARVAPQAGNAR